MQATNEMETNPDMLIPLGDVPKLRWLPRRRRGSRIAIATLHRWASKGIRGRRLRCMRVGETRCTTEPWLREFFEALAEPDHASTSHVVEPSATTMRRATAAARRLERDGF